MYPDGVAAPRTPGDVSARSTWKLSSDANFLWSRPPHSGHFLGCIRRLNQRILPTSFHDKRNPPDNIIKNKKVAENRREITAEPSLKPSKVEKPYPFAILSPIVDVLY